MSKASRTSSDALLDQAHNLPTAAAVVLAFSLGASCCGGAIGAITMAPLAFALLGVSLWAVRASEPGSDVRVDSSRAVTMSIVSVVVVLIGTCLGLGLVMFGGFIAGYLSVFWGI